MKITVCKKFVYKNQMLSFNLRTNIILSGPVHFTTASY
jgi:hypothetical protein